MRGRIVAPGSLFCFNRSGRSEHYADWPQVRWATRFGVPENDADVIILSVRPRDFRQTTFDCAGKLVLSLMAGVTIDELRQRTGARRIARAMPNAAVEIGRSYSPWVTWLPRGLHVQRSNGIPPAHPKGQKTPRVRAQPRAQP